MASLDKIPKPPGNILAVTAGNKIFQCNHIENFDRFSIDLDDAITLQATKNPADRLLGVTL